MDLVVPERQRVGLICSFTGTKRAGRALCGLQGANMSKLTLWGGDDNLWARPPHVKQQRWKDWGRWSQHSSALSVRQSSFPLKFIDENSDDQRILSEIHLYKNETGRTGTMRRFTDLVLYKCREGFMRQWSPLILHRHVSSKTQNGQASNLHMVLCTHWKMKKGVVVVFCEIIWTDRCFWW